MGLGSIIPTLMIVALHVHAVLPALISVRQIHAFSGLKPVRAVAEKSVAVEVDWSRPARQTASMSGFLHSVSVSEPPDEFVRPLKPGFWRVSSAKRFYNEWTGNWSETYRRLKSLDTHIQLVLSDSWGYGAEVTPPYENWESWERFVRAEAAAHRGESLSWDVWNEPNLNEFWPGTRRQFFETYVRAYRVLRQELGPEVMIGGPSIAVRYDDDFVRAFLDFCVQNQPCQVNFLSYHELESSDAAILRMSSNLALARTHLKDPRYAKLKIRRIYVNEVVPEAYHYDPAATVAILSQLERGRADGAARTCWKDSAGTLDCFNYTLDGLVTSDRRSRRAVWWAYKTYADGILTRIASQSNNPRFSVLASRAGAGGFPQLIYSWLGSAPPHQSAKVRFTNLAALPRFRRACSVRVSIAMIPADKDKSLTRPILLDERVAQIVPGTMEFELPALQPGVAYVLQMRPLAQRAQRTRYNCSI